MKKTEIQQVLEALRSINLRLTQCARIDGVTAGEAYDSFYRDVAHDAIALCEASLARVDEPIGYIDRAALSRLHTKCATIWPGTNEIDAVPVFVAPNQGAQE